MKKSSTSTLTLLSNVKLKVEDFFQILCPSQTVQTLTLIFTRNLELGLGYEFRLQEIRDVAFMRPYSVCAHKSNNLSSHVRHNFDRPSYFMYLKSWQAVVKFCNITFTSLVSIAIKEGTLCSKNIWIYVFSRFSIHFSFFKKNLMVTQITEQVARAGLL